MYETGVYYLSVPEIFEQHLQTLCQVYLRDLPRKSLEPLQKCITYGSLPFCLWIHPTAAADSNERITAVIAYIEDHYAEDLSLDHLAALSSIPGNTSAHCSSNNATSFYPTLSLVFA